ncbi:MAG: lytic transglycosylase domain-containing protein [Methylocella sp.]
MLRILSGVIIASLTYSVAFADPAERPKNYDDFIAHQAQMHGVPEPLVHRIVKRESRYNPKLVHNRCYGLMQIKYATARAMGYKGAPSGLLDPQINMTYAIPYLSNAYKVAEGDEDRAVALFAGGYYYVAKKKNMLDALRTASSPPLTPEPAALPPSPPPPPNPLAGLLSFLAGPAEAAQAQPSQQVSAAIEPASPAAGSGDVMATQAGPALQAQK